MPTRKEPASTRHPMIGLRLGDRYELVRELGRGGMGVVYRASDPVLGREVAVKMIAAGELRGERSDELHEQRFRREARLVAQLEHPSIVPIYDFGRHRRWLYFVMPLLDGRTLAELVAARELELGEALEITAQAADALDYSAARGVIHRDIKPENVMVGRSEGRALRVWVMDFGLAFQTSGSRLTKPDQLPGTPAYLSPEYVLSLDLDGRSDLYSLATVLYECLTGAPPFQGPERSILYQIVNELPPPLQDRGVDLELAYLVESCLAKDPGDRPARCSDLAAALREIRASLGERAAIQVPLPDHAPEPGASRRRSGSGVPPFIGRARQLAELSERARMASRGICQLVLIAGEAGSGKTRLLSEAARRLRSRGFRVLHGRFPGEESSFPHHGFCELILDYFRQAERSPAGESPSGSRSSGVGEAAAAAPDLSDLGPELRTLFPVLSEVPVLREAELGGTGPGQISYPEEPTSRPSSDDRTRVFELLARTFLRLIAGQPTALLLESLHGAEASIEALEYIVRRLGATPTLVVATYRNDETPRRHPLLRLVRRLRGDPAFHQLRLEPWSLDEVRELAAAWIARRPSVRVSREVEGLAQRLYETADGHPFFTCELLRSAIEAGAWSRESSAGSSPAASSSTGTNESPLASLAAFELDELPETIQQAVESRLERLPEVLLELLTTASVLGRDFEVRELAALWEGDEDVDDAIERLLREGLLEEDRAARDLDGLEAPARRGRSHRVHFVSALVRDVLHRNLTRRQRKRLHRRCAEQLEQRYEGRLERVYPRLVDHFSQADVALKTVTYSLMLARRSAGVYAPAETLRATRAALEFVVDYELDASGEVEGELRMLLAGALRTSGNVEGARREAAKAVAALERAGEPAAAAEAALLAAETAWQVRRIEDNRRWLARGIELARRASATRKLRELLTFAATVSNLRGEHREARELLREVDELRKSGRGAPAAPDGAQAGGVLRTVLPVPITTTDPALSLSVEDAEVLGCVFEPLLDTDGDGNLIPRLAVEWRALAEGRRWRLMLAEGLVFADGAPLDAAAVKAGLEASIRRAGDHGPAAGVAAMLPLGFQVLDGVPAFRAGDAGGVRGIVVTGARSLELRLSEPLPFFPALLSDLRTAIVRESPASAEDAADRAEPNRGIGRWVGTGPFRLSRRDARGVTLERNPRARPHPPPCERLDFRNVADAAAVAAGLLSGELDIGMGLLPADLETVLRDPGFRDGLVEIPRKSTYFVLFHRFGAATRRPELRRALVGAVRVRDLVWRTLGRFARPAGGLIPPGLLGHRAPGPQRTSLSRDEAAELLHEAGLETPMRLRAIVHPLIADRYAPLLEALRDCWRSIGCEVDVEEPSVEAYLGSWAAPADLLIGRWLPDYHDPDGLTYALLHSRHGVFRRYCSAPDLDELLERARRGAGATQRRRLYRRIEGWLAAADALLPLFHEIDYRIAGPRIRGLRHLPGPPYVNYSELVKLEDRPRPVPQFSGAGSLRVPVTTTFDRLEPSMALYVEPAAVVPNVFETLLTVEEGARIAPCLASRFRSEDGGRRLRLELRSGVRFHDGRRLTARDVRYSFERLLKTPFPGGESALLPIRGARAFRAGDADEVAGLKLVSPRELILELDEPLSFFPAMLTSPTTAIVPEGSRDFASNWQRGCAGTGPFRLVHCAPGARIDLEAHPEHWRAPPRCRRLVFELGVPTGRIAEEFRAGRFAIASNLPPGEAEALRQDKAFAAGFVEAPGFSTYFLALNSQRPPFSDLEARRALRDALDAPGIARAALGRMALPAEGLICPGLLGHEPARREPFPSLVESRSPAALGLLEVSLHPAYRGQYRSVWEGCREVLASLGAELQVSHRSMPEILRELRGGNVDLAAARRLAAFPDADAFVGLLHSRDGLLGKLVARPEIDRLIEKGRVETDPGLRHALYSELEEILARDVLLIPLFDEQIYCFARPEIHGLRLRLGWPRIAYEELGRS